MPTLFCVLFTLTGSAILPYSPCSIVTGLLFSATSVIFSIGCSLVARTAAQALLLSFLYLVATGVLNVVAIGVLEEGSGPCVWVLTACLAVVTTRWSRRSTSPWAVGTYFIALYFVFTSLATFWTFDGRQAERPLAYAHPGFMTIVALTHELRRDKVNPGVVYPLYWLALSVHFAWMYRWLLANFDRLTNRIHPPAPTAATSIRGANRIDSSDLHESPAEC